MCLSFVALCKGFKNLKPQCSPLRVDFNLLSVGLTSDNLRINYLYCIVFFQRQDHDQFIGLPGEQLTDVQTNQLAN